MKRMLIILLFATLLTACNTQPEQQQQAEFSTVKAELCQIGTDAQNGTLLDSDGELWAISAKDLQCERLKDIEYTITYGKDFELISIAYDGKIIEFY